MNASVFLVIVSLVMISACANAPSDTDTGVDTMKGFRISSSAFAHNTMMPRKYSCQGDDMNPPLTIEGIPQNAKSLALVMDDPDAPMGTWDHWIMWNIPVTNIIAENTVPSGAVQGVNSWGTNAYGGPCPPKGVHRYFFKLYALDKVLDLEENSDKNALEQAMQGHIIDKTEFLGLYKKT